MPLSHERRAGALQGSFLCKGCPGFLIRINNFINNVNQRKGRRQLCMHLLGSSRWRRQLHAPKPVEFELPKSQSNLFQLSPCSAGVADLCGSSSPAAKLSWPCRRLRHQPAVLWQFGLANVCLARLDLDGAVARELQCTFGGWDGVGQGGQGRAGLGEWGWGEGRRAQRSFTRLCLINSHGQPCLHALVPIYLHKRTAALPLLPCTPAPHPPACPPLHR